MYILQYLYTRDLGDAALLDRILSHKCSLTCCRSRLNFIIFSESSDLIRYANPSKVSPNF
jgi:hypothetical protein